MPIATEQGGQGSFVIEWREGFRTGIAEVDAEHQQLFALVKRLAPHSVKSVLGELVEYVVTHFTHEEALMQASGYPGLQQHIELHEVLAAQVSGFLLTGTNWSDARVRELRSFLNKWLVGHILTHDLPFGRWYHTRSQAPAAHPEPAPEEPTPSFFAQLLGRR
jgi:hemerythrin